MYKLIALDMDGTLLRTDQTIHPDTLRDLRAAAEHGVQVAYCSGRALSELRPYFSLLPMMRWAVCYSGAMVYDCREERAVFHAPIPQPLVAEILDAARDYGAMPELLREAESIVSGADLDHIRDFHLEAFLSLFRKTARQSNDLLADGRQYRDLLKLNLFFRTISDRQEIRKRLDALPLEFVELYDTALELNARGVTKGTGLTKLAEILGISMGETVGIGDSGNDREMFRHVGLAVAMGNAEPGIRELCAMTTGDNDHNGVGEAIRKILRI